MVGGGGLRSGKTVHSMRHPTSGFELTEVRDAMTTAEDRRLAVEVSLRMVRNYHGLARTALAAQQPNRAAAKRLMKFAAKTGRAIAPYLLDQNLRRHVVAYEPMSAEEWQNVDEVLRTNPDRFYLYVDTSS